MGEQQNNRDNSDAFEELTQTMMTAPAIQLRSRYCQSSMRPRWADRWRIIVPCWAVGSRYKVGSSSCDRHEKARVIVSQADMALFRRLR